MEPNRRSWLFNAAIRKTLGLKNPHEPVRDEYSYLIEDHVDKVVDNIIEHGAEVVWKSFNPLKDAEKLGDRIEVFQTNMEICLKDQKNVYQILMGELPKGDLTRIKLENSGDVIETFKELMNDESFVAQSRFASSMKNSMSAVESFEKERDALLADSLLEENLDLIKQSIEQKKTQPNVA